jgi:hypothetical protein
MALCYDASMRAPRDHHPSRPTLTLPAGYRPAGAIDLSTNLSAQIGLSAVAIVLFFLFGAGFIWIIGNLRPEVGGIGGSFGPGGVLLGLLALLLTTVAVLVLHEAIHGLCFWIFTRAQPQYGFKGLYAYAAAPDWYLPRAAYAITGAAPLVLISLGGLALALVVPPAALPLLIYALSMNAAGAIGDILVIAWIVVSPRGALFRDGGDAVARFVPEA